MAVGGGPLSAAGRACKCISIIGSLFWAKPVIAKSTTGKRIVILISNCFRIQHNNGGISVIYAGREEGVGYTNLIFNKIQLFFDFVF
ncbi:MAG TPA: hypothetical protein DIT95_17575 [Arenibacter sp.]|jgi:hypothetical protein|nr:hypothetical protein [Arenibacter sp.]